ncbi:MAG: peptidoglycan -binding protein [Alphaproteobacteria bacterium]
MLESRRARRSIDIWPGFVDALASLLIIIIFVLLVFVLAQVFLSQALSGRDEALSRLNRQISELAELLNLEVKTNEDLRRTVAQLSGELQASLVSRERLREQLDTATTDQDALKRALDEANRSVAADREKIELQLRELAQLRQDIDILRSLRADLESRLSATETDRNLHKEASEEHQRQVELLNRQMLALREQLAALASALAASEQKSRDQEVQIANLGQRLNAALASRVAELARYRSEFFGRLREVLGDRQDVRIVGDRFVFQSEVLFESASADLGEEGRTQLARLAATLQEIAARIPSNIDWILQVDGHTDRRPIATPRFPSNWELSTARAISVVRFLNERGIPAEHLSPAGFGEFHPIDQGADEIALRRNRRIEIRLTQR